MRPMPLRRYLRDAAPFWDIYDSVFAAVLGVIIVGGYATFVETLSPSGLLAAWTEFIQNSGLLGLLTSWTAIIGLYRLRHQQDKTRPSVREDFENLDGENPTDFGLRNFGPGPALYVQAVVTVEQEQEHVEVTRYQVHDPPIHLREGDFASLILDAEEDWVGRMAKKYEIDQSDDAHHSEQENAPMVNLYYSYVSQSGARTPGRISAKRDDTDVLDDIKEPDAEAHHIKLAKLVEAC